MPMSSILSPLEPLNILKIKDRAIAFWLSLWDIETGGFRFASHQPATLMATAYSILGLEFFNGLSHLSESQKVAVINFLMSNLQPDGSFCDPLFRLEDIQSKEHGLAYFREETTTMCQQTLDALSAPAPTPRDWDQDYRTANGITAYFESLAWKNPWLDSNPVMFVLSQLCHDIDRHQRSDLLNIVDTALDWLDDHQSAETGLWQGSHEVSLMNAMAATFHFTFYYGYRHRPIQYVNQIIDSCLRLQEQHGLFCGKAIGQTCLDYDAIDLLAKASLTTNYRSDEVSNAMKRAFDTLLGLYNSTDGGFANQKEMIIDRSQGRKAKLLRKIGLSKFLPPAISRVPAQGVYSVCWRLLSCDTAQSNAFSTWFRLLTLRLATQELWVGTDTTSDFTFRRLPFLGYHNPVAAQSSVQNSYAEIH
jgi:hypothetical protein